MAKANPEEKAAEVAGAGVDGGPSAKHVAARLSMSVKALRTDLSKVGGPVPSWAFVSGLLRKGGDYGGKGKDAEKFSHAPGPEGAKTRPVDEWLDAVEQRLAPEVFATEGVYLEGRVLILGLARVDPDLGDYLDAHAPRGLMKALGTEALGNVEKGLSKPLGSVEALFRKDADPSPFHLDSPTSDDRLGRRALAHTLASRLRIVQRERRQVEDPSSFLMNLHGEWGSGKSSLLRLLEEELRPSSSAKALPDSWVIVRFNAWQHQRLAPPWWFLLDAVYRQAKAQGSWARASYLISREMSWRSRTLRPGVVGGAALAVLFAVLLDPVGAYWDLSETLLQYLPAWIGGGLEDAGASAKALSTILSLLTVLAGMLAAAGRSFASGSALAARDFVQGSVDPMREIQRHYQDLVGWIGRPVAILVDDLDRCQAAYAVELLEGIQTLFGDPRVVFVVAADQR